MKSWLERSVEMERMTEQSNEFSLSFGVAARKQHKSCGRPIILPRKGMT